MNYVTEIITPEKATAYLNTSKGNRPLSKIKVKLYADIIRSGGWMDNGTTIVFDNEGHLIDGHHRLSAIVMAGIPVKMDVGRGAPPEAFTTIDCGRQRNFQQLLAIQGVKNYSRVGSIVAANELICMYGRLYDNNGLSNMKGGRLDNTAKFNLYLKDPEGFQHAGNFIVKLESRCAILSSGWAGGIYYYLIHSGGYDEKFVEEFFDDLYSLGTCKYKAIDMLRIVITKSKLSKTKKLKSEALWALIAKTWNCYASGTQLSILKYSETEDIPTLKLLKK